MMQPPNMVPGTMPGPGPGPVPGPVPVGPAGKNNRVKIRHERFMALKYTFSQSTILKGKN